MEKKKLLLLLPIVLAFAFTLSLSLSHGHSIGVDIHYHISVAELYASGNFSEALNLMLRVNGCYYPPLFHLLLVPFVWLGVALPFSAVLQTLCLPLAVASLGFVVYKHHGSEGSAFAMFVALGSWAYIDRVLAAQPQALDVVLLPLVYYFALKGSDRKFSIASIVLVYNHGVVNVANLLGSVMKYLKDKKYRILAVTALATLPILVVTAYYLVEALTHYTAYMLVDQQLIFWTQPLEFWIRYVRLPVLGFAIAIYLTIQWIKKKEVKPISKLCIVTLALSSVMIVVWADRFGQYATIPLTLLLVDGYLRIKDKLARAWLLATVVGFMGLLYVTLWFLTVNNGFQT